MVKRKWDRTGCPVVSRACCLLVLAVGFGGRLSQAIQFKLAFLDTSTKDYNDTKEPGAVMAIEDYQRAGKLRDHEFEVISIRTECNEKLTVERALDAILDDHVDVFLGPTCSEVCQPLSWLINYWDLAVFPDSSTNLVLGDKVTYNNVIRVAPVTNKLGKAFIGTLDTFSWVRFVIMSYSESVCEFGAVALNENTRGTHYIVSEWMRHPYSADSGNPLPLPIIDNYLNNIRQRGRIIFMCMDHSDIVRVMLRAQEQGMTNGDYVFFYYTIVPENDFHYRPWDHDMPLNTTPSEYQRRKEAFYCYKMITAASLSGPSMTAFLSEVLRRLHGEPWEVSPDYTKEPKAAIWSAFLYDATTLYLRILDRILAAGMTNYRNSNILFDYARNEDFVGMTGQVLMDDIADREPNYWLWYYGPGAQEMTPFTQLKMIVGQDGIEVEQLGTEVYWGTPGNVVPLDTPICGFDGKLCPADNSDQYIIIGAVVGGLLVLSLVISAYIYFQRKQMLEQELTQMLWRISWEEISQASKRIASASSMSSDTSGTNTHVSDRSGETITTKAQQPSYASVGFYKGNMVAVRKVDKDRITLSRENLLELKFMREMNHDNLNPFIGACIDPPNIAIITAYAPKGSLQDIIANDDMKLDWMFKCSLLSDLANGMGYLHTTPLKSHGQLKSSNCLVDSRWMLKITSYGLSFFKEGERIDKEMGEYQRYMKMLWTSPELLRMGGTRPPGGTQKGDVYSFAIICQEVLYQAPPFFMDTMTPRELVDMVKKSVNDPYRPEIPRMMDDLDSKIVLLMKECWAELADDRPNFEAIKKRLLVINKGRKFNIVDNMIQKLEKYASNLEETIAQRTSELIDEKKKTDQLLYKMLPQVVADRLKSGQTVEAEIYDNVTIYFSDVVGFTSLSSESSPMEVVDLLNDLYTLFDGIIDKADVYKVETIGDAYMVVGGVPKPNRQHAGEIATMSMDLLSAVYTNFKVRHRPGLQLKLRIGIHSGSCAAGVVGLTMPRYCLFGDTVNMASRMESNGEALKIHVSQAAYSALQRLSVYQMRPRGEMEIKGKGKQITYWLTGKNGYHKPLPPQE